MLFHVILLDSNENFLAFLDYDLIDVKEEQEQSIVRAVEVTYSIDDAEKAKNLFQIGNKLWISGFNGSSDCLYVINEAVKIDFYEKNTVTFYVEDVISELNHVELFTQTDIAAGRGFTITTKNGEPAVTVNRPFLEYMFGDYYNIGIIQDCLNSYIQKISPTGTMTKMELLRYIETETSNIFRTRYEKSPTNNIIYRYLDFLNPEDSTSEWELGFNYDVPQVEETSDELTNEDENETEIDDIIIPTYIPDTPLDVDNTLFRLVNLNGEVLTCINENDEEEEISYLASDLGLSGEEESYTVLIKYGNINGKQGLYITINSKTVDFDIAENETLTSLNIDTNNFTSIATTNPNKYVTLPNYTRFEMINTDNDKLIYYQEISPNLGDVHEDIIDLGYSAKNITYEIDENDSYNSIAPLLSVKNSSEGLNRSQMTTLINRWRNLSISKGATIPMILQRIQVDSGTSMGTYNVSSNYYVTPIKKSNVSSGQVEYIQGTAYWNAPFEKKAGELFIRDYEDTGIQYNTIHGRVEDKRGLTSLKNGTVETSAEDVYEIYNDVAMELKDKRYPSLDLVVDVANYQNGRTNNYNIYDKVYIKVPGYERLVTATVLKTFKNPKDIGENSLTLTNYSVNTKTPQTDTELLGANLTFKYPNKANLTVTLQKTDGTIIPNKLISYTIYSVEDNSNKFYKTYNKKTGTNGKATLQLSLKPGNYLINASFGGDVIYNNSNIDISVKVTGIIAASTDTKKKQKTTTSNASKKTTTAATKTITKTSYYDKFGRSSDIKYICSIGLPSRASSLKKYGYKFWKTVFVNKCPVCGKNTLYWGWNWGTYFRGRREGGSAEGHIFCDHCDADFDAINGENHNRSGKPKLTIWKAPVKSSKSEAQKLKNGKVIYKTETIKVEEPKPKTVNRQQIDNSIAAYVKRTALNIVGNKTDYQAAKAIATWMKNINYGNYPNFNKSASGVLSSRRGNCCDQTRLMLQLMDAAGVGQYYTMKYVHVCCSSGGMGHVFAKLIHKSDGASVYVDPCKNGLAWGHYVTGWGRPPGRQSTYPNRPF